MARFEIFSGHLGLPPYPLELYTRNSKLNFGFLVRDGFGCNKISS